MLSPYTAVELQIWQIFMDVCMYNICLRIRENIRPWDWAVTLLFANGHGEWSYTARETPTLCTFSISTSKPQYKFQVIDNKNSGFRWQHPTLEWCNPHSTKIGLNIVKWSKTHTADYFHESAHKYQISAPVKLFVIKLINDTMLKYKIITEAFSRLVSIVCAWIAVCQGTGGTLNTSTSAKRS